MTEEEQKPPPDLGELKRKWENSSNPRHRRWIRLMEGHSAKRNPADNSQPPHHEPLPPQADPGQGQAVATADPGPVTKAALAVFVLCCFWQFYAPGTKSLWGLLASSAVILGHLYRRWRSGTSEQPPENVFVSIALLPTLAVLAYAYNQVLELLTQGWSMEILSRLTASLGLVATLIYSSRQLYGADYARPPLTNGRIVKRMLYIPLLAVCTAIGFHELRLADDYSEIAFEFITLFGTLLLMGAEFCLTRLLFEPTAEEYGWLEANPKEARQFRESLKSLKYRFDLTLIFTGFMVYGIMHGGL